MENVKIYNQDGNLAEEIETPPFLRAPWNADLVHQIFKALAANKRKPIAHTKTRGEVRGGGIKPWRQKGTGRARHGSIRSPLWRHGGVAFGPRNTTDFSQKINKKMIDKALTAALSKKFSSGELKIINKLDIIPKTKNLARVIQNLTGNKSSLLIIADEDKSILRAAANLPKVKGVKAKDLSLYDVLTHKYILIEQKALEELRIMNYE
jgi:large subunit ribosomal protein L4